MQRATKNTHAKGIIATPGHVVKGKIITAGVSLGQLAKAANISRPAMSNLLAGISSKPAAQVVVWEAFCRLTGSSITLPEFWGELLSERMTG